MSGFPFSRPFSVIALSSVVMLAIGLSAGATAEENDASRPTLADLMTLTQLRHYKLWYAERQENWPLAAYELGQFRNTIERIAKLYPAASSVAQADLIHEKTDPAMADLRQAITDRNGRRFEAAFVKITDACNQCHQAAGVGFIAIQVPKRSPFSNQDFNPVQ